VCERTQLASITIIKLPSPSSSSCPALSLQTNVMSLEDFWNGHHHHHRHLSHVTTIQAATIVNAEAENHQTKRKIDTGNNMVVTAAMIITPMIITAAMTIIRKDDHHHPHQRKISIEM
jgi:hypothetical protein